MYKKSAIISDDKKYRYELRRIWKPKSQLVCWVMLNPSIADANFDDPTIRRCMGYTMRWGCGGIIVVNLFALRATDSKEERYEQCEGAQVTSVPMTQIPISESAIEAYLSYSSPKGDGTKWTVEITKGFSIDRVAGEYKGRFDVDEIKRRIEDGDITKESVCILEVSYPIRERRL